MVDVIVGGSKGRMGSVLVDSIMKNEVNMCVLGGIDPLNTDEKYKTLEGFLNSEMFSYIKKVQKKEEKNIVYTDFTHPDSVIGNIKTISEAGIDSVIGTTKWYQKIGEVEKIATDNERIIAYAPNFSLGTNALFYVTEQMAKILGPKGYDFAVEELHHTGKVDAPSGTAKTLGKIIIENMENKDKATFCRTDKRLENEVDVLGGRVGKITGHHEVWITPDDNYSERLVIQHDAFSREVFAKGAKVCIEWVNQARKQGKEPGLYEFRKDVLGL